jgi:hypothetical protein
VQKGGREGVEGMEGRMPAGKRRKEKSGGFR